MLLEAGCPSNSHCASRAIGYRQALGFLEAQRAAAVAAAAASTAAAAAAANIDAGAAAAVRTADGPTPQAVVRLDTRASALHSMPSTPHDPPMLPHFAAPPPTHTHHHHPPPRPHPHRSSW